MVNFPSWQMQYITGVYKPQNSDAVTGSNENGDVNNSDLFSGDVQGDWLYLNPDEDYSEIFLPPPTVAR